MTAKWALKKLGIAALLAPLLTALFAVTLTLAFSLPNAPIAENILERPSVLLDRRADNGRVIDADTECIGLSVGLFGSEATGPTAFQRAVHAESLYGCGDFLKWLDGEARAAHRDYFRYWHGHTLVSRSLLSVLPYNDVRGLLFTLSAFLLGALVWRLGVDFSALTGLSFLLPFVVLNAMGFWVVVTKAVTWFLAIGAALYLSRRQTGGEPPVIVFFVIGALTAFFDFLTTPALIFALPILVYFLYGGRAQAEGRWRSLLLLGAFWSVGYLGLWGAKFALAAAVLDLPVWRDVAEATIFRLRGASDQIDTFLPGAALYKNFAALKTLWGAVAVIVFVIAPLITAKRRSAWAALWRDGRIFVAIALIPILWLEALSNHSQIHAAFTHLNFAPAAILACLVLTGQSSILTGGAVKGRGSAAAHGVR